MFPPPSTPGSIKLSRNKLKDLLQGTPLAQETVLKVWGTEDYSLSLNHVVFNNTGYKKITFKDILHHKLNLKLSTGNPSLVPLSELEETIFVLGTQDGIWEPGTDIMFVSVEIKELDQFVIRFNEEVDDLLLVPEELTL